MMSPLLCVILVAIGGAVLKFKRGGLRAPSRRCAKSKKTGRNRQAESLTKYVQETFERLLYEQLELRHSCKPGFLAFILVY